MRVANASIKIEASLLKTVKAYKEATGIPIQTFIEYAILEKLRKAPKKIQEKLNAAHEQTS